MGYSEALKFVPANLKYSDHEPELDFANSYIVPSNFAPGECNLHAFFSSVLYHYYSVLLIYVQFFYAQQFEYSYAELIVSRQNFHVTICQYALAYFEPIANTLYMLPFHYLKHLYASV